MPHTTQNTRGRAFTLVEVMLAVLLLALLSTGAAMSLTQPLRAARAQDLKQALRSFDHNARAAAIASGKSVRMAFDLEANTISRFDGPDLAEMRSCTSLPGGYRLSEARFLNGAESDGTVQVDISSLGFTRSYSVHLIGPHLDQWILFAGLGGDVIETENRASSDAILANTANLPRHDAD